MKPYLLQVESVKQNLREDFLYLTEVLLKKTIPHANKQLQDTLTKYFLENYVSDLLKDKMRKNNNRAVFQEISSTISSGRPKYLKLLNAFEDKIRFFQLDSQYNNMLLILILDVGRHPRESEEWRTHTRKRMLSLLLYVHWNEQDKRDEFQSFFEMWKVAYPENPLPQRQFKNPKIHSFDQKNMYSSQSLEEDSLYNQKNNNNNESSNDQAAQHTNKNKKIKTNKNDHQNIQQLQQAAGIQIGIAAVPNGLPQGFNFGNHFAFNQQQQQQQQQPVGNGLQIHKQAHPSSLLNQNIIKNHASQQNGQIFNSVNVDFLNQLGSQQNTNQHHQGNFFGTINKNEIGGGDHQQNQQQPLSNSQALFNQQHKNYFQNTNPINANSNNMNPNGNPTLQIGGNTLPNREFVILDNNNFGNMPFKNNPVKQESTEDNINVNENQNPQQKQQLQQQHQQQQQQLSNQSFIENQQNSQLNQINGNATGQENNFESSLNVTNNSMFFTNNQSIGGHNAIMALNGGQNYPNFFQNGGGNTASYNYSQNLHNANFMNYNSGSTNNTSGSVNNNNNNNNSMINMTSSYNQFNQQGNSINPKTSESQNFGLHLSTDKYDKQIERFMMDNSYNNELFLASQNINYYPNPQNMSHINQIAAAAAAASIQNSNNNRDNTNFQQPSFNNNNNNIYNAGKQNSNPNSAKANSKKKQMGDFNQNNNNNLNQTDSDMTPVKLEQQITLQQQQQQQQQQQLNKQNFMNSTQFLSSKILQSTNDHIQGFNKSRFNMNNSGQNFINFQNNQSYLNGSQLNGNIYSLGGIGFQNEIYGFFSQYYADQKEEFSWESTEPLSIYAANQAPILSELNTLFLTKLNALPTIQKAKENKIKLNNLLNNQQIISKEKEDDCMSEIVDSYEVDQNPISQ